MGRRICHVTTVHVWHDTRIFERMCVGLTRRGFDVTLVAPVDHAWDERGVHLRPTGLTGKTQRVLGGGRLLRLLAGINADIFHFHDPELLPWMSLFRRRGHRVVYDVHEYYPESVVDSNYFGWRAVSRLAGAAFGVVEPALAKRLDGVVGVTAPITERFTGGRARTAVVRNLVDREAATTPVAAARLPTPRTLVVAGTFDALRLVEETLEAVALLARQWPDIAMFCIGDLETDPLAARMRARAAQLGIAQRLAFHPRVRYQQLQSYLAASAVGLALRAEVQNNRWGLPNRLFEFMAQGVPVVASPMPMVHEVLNETRCGVLLDAGTPQAIAAAVDRLFRDPREAAEMGRRGRQAILDKYNWESELDRLVALYDVI